MARIILSSDSTSDLSKELIDEQLKIVQTSNK